MFEPASDIVDHYHIQLQNQSETGDQFAICYIGEHSTLQSLII